MLHHARVQLAHHTKIIKQQIGEALEGFAGQVKAIAESLPNQPPVAAITGRLDQRTGEVYRQSNELQSAIVNYMGAPREVLRAATSDFNARLENLLMGECWRCLDVLGVGAGLLNIGGRPPSHITKTSSMLWNCYLVCQEVAMSS